jgi:hypothetical protein
VKIERHYPSLNELTPSFTNRLKKAIDFVFMTRHWQYHSPQFEHDQLYPLASTSPWGGHREFVYDLICWLEPKSILELGTHYGVSLFAFAQAVKFNNLPTKISAIDTWEGDEQAGFYGNEVLDSVKKVQSTFFPKVEINLIQATFDKGIQQIPDGSCDIIHIDGLHTKEAVMEDFRISSPKLSPNGIMLFHDVDPDCGYGSALFFNELCEKYPGFRFTHSWGLGVLSLKQNPFIDTLLDMFQKKYLERYEYFYRANFSEKAYAKSVMLIEEKDTLIQKLEALITDRDEAIKAQTILIQERDIAIKKLDSMVADRDILIKDQERILQDFRLAFENTEKLVQERDLYIKQLESQINQGKKDHSGNE